MWSLTMWSSQSTYSRHRCSRRRTSVRSWCWCVIEEVRLLASASWPASARRSGVVGNAEHYYPEKSENLQHPVLEYEVFRRTCVALVDVNGVPQDTDDERHH